MVLDRPAGVVALPASGAALTPPSVPALPRSLLPTPDVAFSQQVIHNGVCASVHVKSRQIPSNSCQNRSKRRRFPSKSDQKRAHFVMPILTFWGVTPSGASARAVLASQKGKKGAFSGAPGQVPKVIHSYPQWHGRRAAVKPRRACPARVAGGGPPAGDNTRKRPGGNPLVTVARVAWSRCCVTMLGAKGRNMATQQGGHATRN